MSNVDIDNFDFGALARADAAKIARKGAAADPDREGVELTKRRTHCQTLHEEIESLADSADAALVQKAREAHDAAWQSGYTEEAVAALECAVQPIKQTPLAGDALELPFCANKADPSGDDHQPQDTSEASSVDGVSTSDAEDVDCDQMPRAPGPHPEYRVDGETGAAPGTGAVTQHGATLEEWEHFANTLGLVRDLLPVVSNLGANFSPNSKMKRIGKTPSKYNGRHEVVGIPDWTSKTSSAADVKRWSAQPDYGICVQTRRVRAIDVDVTDEEVAKRVATLISGVLGHELPRRERDNSVKFLLAFRLEGAFKKRIIDTSAGRIEFLADGQQFVAAGTHPSGARYTWRSGLPAEIPSLAEDDFERVWSALEHEFSSAVAHQAATGTPSEQVQSSAILEGGRNEFLSREAFRLRKQGHDPDAIYAVISALNNVACSPSLDDDEVRAIANGKEKIKPDDPAVDLDMLDVLADEDSSDAKSGPPEAISRVPNASAWSAFGGTFAAPRYIWHHVLQAGCLYALTAKWGHAKTALMLTLLLHVITGRALGGHKTERCKALYLCGENPDDVKLRIKASLGHFGISDADIEEAVYFTDRPFQLDSNEQVVPFVQKVREHGPFGLVVIDTGPAHSGAEQENDNREMHELAMAMRRMIRPLGSPAMVALMHPTKNADKHSLEPRGGGAFSGSIDGELCAWNEQGVVELFHRTKFRGPGFAPIFFKLRRVELEGVFDNFGEPVITILAEETDDRPVSKRQPQHKNQKLAWQVVNDLIDLGGDGVPVDIVIGAVVDKLPLQGGQRDNRGTRVREALEGLQNGRWIEIHDNMIRIVGGGK